MISLITYLVFSLIIVGFGNYCDKMTKLAMDGTPQPPKFCQQGLESTSTRPRRRRNGKFMRSRHEDPENEEFQSSIMLKPSSIKFKVDARNRVIGYHDV